MVFNLFKRKPEMDLRMKYIDPWHWTEIQRIDHFYRYDDNKEKTISEYLKYEDQITSTGHLIMVFRAMFMISDNSKKQSMLVDKILASEYLNEFDDIDRQYLIDLASAVLHYDDKISHPIKQLAKNAFPQQEGVNPLLTQLFRIEYADE